MAKKVLVELVDDYDGESRADETVEFAVDGRSYEIDLSEANAGQFRAELSRWIGRARRTNGRRPGGGQPRAGQLSREQLAAIREWARRQGHQVADRGRIPRKLIDEFNAVRVAERNAYSGGEAYNSAQVH